MVWGILVFFEPTLSWLMILFAGALKAIKITLLAAPTVDIGDISSSRCLWGERGTVAVLLRHTFRG